MLGVAEIEQLPVSQARAGDAKVRFVICGLLLTTRTRPFRTAAVPARSNMINLADREYSNACHANCCARGRVPSRKNLRLAVRKMRAARKSYIVNRKYEGPSTR